MPINDPSMQLTVHLPKPIHGIGENTLKRPTLTTCTERGEGGLFEGLESCTHNQRAQVHHQAIHALKA